MNNSSNKQGWIVVLAGTGINLALGVLYSWSVIAKKMTTSWGWSATSASMPYAVACGVFAIMMVFAGRAQDKLGPRLVASVGGALTGLGLILASFASKGNIALMILGFGILAGTGIGLGYASATPAAVKWFPPAKKGLITGIVVSGFGLASVYIAPVTNTLLKNFGINQTFLILGIAFFVATVGLSQFLNNPPAGYAPAGMLISSASTAANSKKHEYDWHEMLKTPQFYLLWSMYAFAAFAGLMIIGHLAKISAAQLPDVNLGFLLVAILAVGNASGRIIAGGVSDKLGRTHTMLLVFLFQALMMGVLAISTTSILLIVSATLIGFNYGANLALFPAVTADYFGTKNLGVNYGLVFTAWGVGGVFGSMVAGKIVDATGSYSMAYLIAAVLCIIASGITFIIKAPNEVDIEVQAVETAN
ncbi:OFA family MFS transporter [Candidatus Oleimmundimicrobium sp.]|uniref:L-lactate MFS transporter n=1 Tax=Candidatus Oleimmundimicrobium sp. TaxID=3060597 RepID=UPI002717CEAD|nr:OFA family MFS transporter [Candidatus Oleimmundimicrobium sp.]MDO8885896.1 OFA family MFS transporter [Candidatus Oleimmundimicrobium sp.]